MPVGVYKYLLPCCNKLSHHSLTLTRHARVRARGGRDRRAAADGCQDASARVY